MSVLMQSKITETQEFRKTMIAEPKQIKGSDQEEIESNST